MEALELRNIIAEYASNADEKVLKIVKAVFESYSNKEEDFFDQLPFEVQELLLKSQEQAYNGNTSPHEDVMKRQRSKFDAQS
jgi:hypothetical protein